MLGLWDRPPAMRTNLVIRLPWQSSGIGFAKNYFTYNTGGAAGGAKPRRAASAIVAEAVFDALGLSR